MDSHYHKFSGPVPYADRFAATSTRIKSTHPQARALEEQLKHEHPRFSTIWPQIQALLPRERNFITAVYLAWSYERDFYEALASGKLPAEVLLCQDTGDCEHGDHYYTYEFSPAKCREMFLKERLDFAQRDVSDFSSQLARIKANVFEGAAETTA